MSWGRLWPLECDRLSCALLSEACAWPGEPGAEGGSGPGASAQSASCGHWRGQPPCASAWWSHLPEGGEGGRDGDPSPTGSSSSGGAVIRGEEQG